VAAQYPRAGLIQAHTAGAWDGRTPNGFWAVARQHPNVYLDIAISIAWYGALERLVATVGADKILFGTDAPFVDPAVAVGRVVFARLRDSEKERILGQNMLDLLARQGR
jgi:predicted TIM-barrel fold metal-dependent hydrolase